MSETSFPALHIDKNSIIMDEQKNRVVGSKTRNFMR